MANFLKMEKKQTVLALLRLGWSYRGIERETGVRRETISKYDPSRDSKPAKVAPDTRRTASTAPASAYSQMGSTWRARSPIRTKTH